MSRGPTRVIEHGSSEPPPVSPGVERGHVMAGETVFVLRAKWHARRGFVAPDMAPLDTERDRRDLHPAVLKPSPSAPDRMASRFFTFRLRPFGRSCVIGEQGTRRT